MLAFFCVKSSAGSMALLMWQQRSLGVGLQDIAVLHAGQLHCQEVCIDHVWYPLWSEEDIGVSEGKPHSSVSDKQSKTPFHGIHSKEKC